MSSLYQVLTTSSGVIGNPGARGRFPRCVQVAVSHAQKRRERTTKPMLSSVERYDPAKNAWEAVAPTSTARYDSAAAVFDGKLYVMGGMADGNALSSVER
jgi:Kelch motif